MIDLVEFTVRSSPMPPEVVATVLDDLLDAVVSRANQSGGTLDKFMGDGFLLFFTAASTPASSGNNSANNGANNGARSREAAVRAALRFVTSLLQELPALNSRWHGFGLNEELRIRAGIASGYCSQGQWGRSDVRAYTIVGTCVGLAERLQSVSAEDSLAMCPVSARLLLNLTGVHLSQPGRMPARFETAASGRNQSFVSTERDLKGFARMRVYHPSDKVRALSN